MRRILIISAVSLIGVLPVGYGQDNKNGQPTRSAAVPVGKPGPGTVWVDAKTKTYYRQGNPLYGKTKKGAYMSEGDALNAGYTDRTEKPIKK
jgi:hypothetical protein